MRLSHLIARVQRATLAAAVGLACLTTAPAAAAEPTTLYVAGTVTADSTGEPIADICVALKTARGAWIDAPDACTDETGHYLVSFTGSSGRYIAHFTDAAGRFASEFSSTFRVSNRATSPAAAAVVNAGLAAAPTGVISGRAVWKDTGTPVADLGAQAYLEGSDFVGGDCCGDAEGNFVIGGLPGGVYTVHLRQFETLNGGWVGAGGSIVATQDQAMRFEIADGETMSLGTISYSTPGVEVPDAGTVSGRIVDAATGQVVTDPMVCLYATSSGVRCYSGSRDGTFSVGNVAPDTYKLIARDSAGHENWVGAGGVVVSSDQEAASWTLTAGDTLNVGDLQLDRSYTPEPDTGG